MISITRAVLVLTLACMAATTAAQPSEAFSMTPSDLPQFLYMHPIPTARVKLYYTPHSPMRSKVLFGIAVPRGGWVGIGWSRDCRMNGSDAVIGGIGSETAPPATYSLTTTATPDPSLQSFVTSFNVSTMPDQLSTLLTVDRSVGGGRVALTGPSVCLIWAYSDSTDPGYHGTQRRGGVPITIPAIGGRNGSGGDVGDGRGVASMAGVAPASKASPSISPSPSSLSSPSSPSSPSSLETPGIAAPGSEGPTSGPAGIGTPDQSTSVAGSNAATQGGPQAVQESGKTSAGNPNRRIGHVEAATRVVLAMIVTVATLRSCLFE